MNLRTVSAVILAAAIPAFGDEIRMKIAPQSGRAEQMRIITQKDPSCTAIEEPTVIAVNEDNECRDKTSSLFKGDTINSSSKCCVKSNLKGYHVWEDKMDVYLQQRVRVDHLFEDGVCFEKWSGGSEWKWLPSGQKYNVYMAQYYDKSGGGGDSSSGDNSSGD